jgi:hypothetical protein
MRKLSLRQSVSRADFFGSSRSKMHLLTLYFLDSGSYSKGVLDWFGFFIPTEYDWIRQVGGSRFLFLATPFILNYTQSQIDWFLQESGTS